MPKRGEVWLVDSGITQKVRPALVISVPFTDTDRALIGVIPHTTGTRGSQFEISVPAHFLAEGAFWFKACKLCRQNIFCVGSEFQQRSNLNRLKTDFCAGWEFPANKWFAENGWTSGFATPNLKSVKRHGRKSGGLIAF